MSTLYFKTHTLWTIVSAFNRSKPKRNQPTAVVYYYSHENCLDYLGLKTTKFQQQTTDRNILPQNEKGILIVSKANIGGRCKMQRSMVLQAAANVQSHLPRAVVIVSSLFWTCSLTQCHQLLQMSFSLWFLHYNSTMPFQHQMVWIYHLKKTPPENCYGQRQLFTHK